MPRHACACCVVGHKLVRWRPQTSVLVGIIDRAETTDEIYDSCVLVDQFRHIERVAQHFCEKAWAMCSPVQGPAERATVKKTLDKAVKEGGMTSAKAAYISELCDAQNHAGTFTGSAHCRIMCQAMIPVVARILGTYHCGSWMGASLVPIAEPVAPSATVVGWACAALCNLVLECLENAYTLLQVPDIVRVLLEVLEVHGDTEGVVQSVCGVLCFVVGLPSGESLIRKHDGTRRLAAARRKFPGASNVRNTRLDKLLVSTHKPSARRGKGHAPVAC